MEKEVFVGLRAERPNKAKHAVAHDEARQRQEGGDCERRRIDGEFSLFKPRKMQASSALPARSAQDVAAAAAATRTTLNERASATARLTLHFYGIK